MLSHVHCTAAATALPDSGAPGSDLFWTALRDLEAEGCSIHLCGGHPAQVPYRPSSRSMVLYLDGVARGFQQGECSGTQSSRRIDSQTIEVLRNCGPGVWTRFVRWRAPKDQLVLEISEQRADGRRFGRRLIFEKQ